jgi:hypothetical protein
LSPQHCARYAVARDALPFHPRRASFLGNQALYPPSQRAAQNLSRRVTIDGLRRQRNPSGRKPGTRIFTVRNNPLGVPTLMSEAK